MECVAASFGSKWMEEKPAGGRILQVDDSKNTFKILLRLFFSPTIRATLQRLQMEHSPGESMAAVASRMAGTFL
ncbi:MAG TPA: hypothetical protein VF011_02480 [Terriglobales bacterium]